MRTLEEVLENMSDQNLVVLARVAKFKLRPFFRDPRAMIQLRDELSKRRLA